MAARAAGEDAFRALIVSGAHARAAEWLVRHYADEVAGLCTAMVRHRTIAEDLAQDTFSRAFQSLGRFRGEASSRTWILTIARNACIDHFRAKKHDPWTDARVSADDPGEEPADDAPLPSDLIERRVDVELALDALTEIDRALVVLRFRNGLEYSELAIAFGLAEGAVRMRMSRALGRMRRALEAVEGTSAAEALPLPLARSRAPKARPVTGAPIGPPEGPPPPAAHAPSKTEGAGGGVFGRLAQAISGVLSPPNTPNPPIGHPLTAYFAATREGLSEELRTRLLEIAREIPGER